MNYLYSDNSLNISKANFSFPENGVSVPLDCSKNEQLNDDEEF